MGLDAYIYQEVYAKRSRYATARCFNACWMGVSLGRNNHSI